MASCGVSLTIPEWMTLRDHPGAGGALLSESLAACTKLAQTQHGTAAGMGPNNSN